MTDADLAAELIGRYADDQAVRRVWIAEGENSDQVKQRTRANTAWLKDVVCRQGWPGLSAVGEAAGTAAFMLAQHADHDLLFQRQCLELLIELADAGDAPKWQVAYLTDRVLSRSGHLQRYGTQIHQGESGWEPSPSEEPETLAERRTGIGLPPIDNEAIAARGVLSVALPVNLLEPRGTDNAS